MADCLHGDDVPNALGVRGCDVRGIDRRTARGRMSLTYREQRGVENHVVAAEAGPLRRAVSITRRRLSLELGRE